MKNNKINLVAAIIYLAASISFILAAIFHAVTLSEGLFSVAVLCLAGFCMLICSIVYLYVFVKNNKSVKDNGRETESV